MVNSGRWIRSGATIVVDLGAFPIRTDAIAEELDSTQPTLRQGASGSAVKTLQAGLAAQRLDPGPIDGYFGPLTDAAVRAFQGARRLQVDGIVGPQTWAALGAAKAPPATQPWKPASPPAVPGGRTVHIDVPFRGYESNDKAGCFRRCTEMAAAVGVTVGGSDLRIQVATSENAQGRITIDVKKAREGLAYIDVRLDAGDPVVVGVSYMDSNYNVDEITDHFVIITGRGTDADQDLYYPFHDPASSKSSVGSDQNVANRFFRTAEGGLFRPAASSAPLGSHIYDVAMVRRNL